MLCKTCVISSGPLSSIVNSSGYSALATADPASSGVESRVRMNEHTRTVLIVDDDPQILRLVEKMLRPRRFNVLMAPKPSDALAICQSQTVDLLISDMRMPEMDGNRLAERVLKLHPETAILLISGHYKEPPAAVRSGQMRFLPKPFFPSQLLQYLRELLPEKPADQRVCDP